MNKLGSEELRKLDTKDVSTYITSLAGYSNNRYDNTLLITAYSALAYYLASTVNLDAAINVVKERFKDEATSSYLINLLEKDFSNVLLLSKKFDADTLKAAALFPDLGRSFNADDHSTPNGIIELALSLLKISSEDSVLDVGSGLGSFLIETGLLARPRELTGIEIQSDSVLVSNIRSAVADLSLSIIQGNVLTYNFCDTRFDKVFSNPPFGVRFSYVQHQILDNHKLADYFEYSKKTATGDWVYALSALQSQHDAGRTVVVMSNAGMWNKADEDIRAKLIQQRVVEGVISLPNKLLSITSIPLTMVVFSRNNDRVRMVDASGFFTPGRRINELRSDDINKIIDSYNNDSSDSCVVPIQEIANQESILNPQRYVNSSSAINDGIPLGDLCNSISRGAMISSSELDRLNTTEETDSHYLMLQNINEGFIDKRLPALTHIEEKYRKYCIRDKNLIVSKISPFKIAMAGVAKGKSILANGNLYFIEIDETKVNPVYVEYYLQSEPGMAQLNKYSKGTAMKSLNLEDLRRIRIPNLSRDVQDSIAEKYSSLRDDLTVLQRQTDMTRYKIAHLFEEVSGS